MIELIFAGLGAAAVFDIVVCKARLSGVATRYAGIHALYARMQALFHRG